ncbi:cytochrome c biogenesis protein CcsA [Ignatzschineria indica]|uniref:Cytochrome C biogenesis protein CcsA n=1 Tax=Ignatzschineria indica TaxID=472583 RepID=A0A2U2APV9_9GAMM|nr:cytochrome-c peroxidase [Ignatzschineria indica]PWD85555.1 cytochrome C biogenesis protein CcsA [Ignatzschineria indica]GGZ88459.1 cytochrome c biogenesis protein CcsA [Ignatzschineria indica]
MFSRKKLYTIGILALTAGVSLGQTATNNGSVRQEPIIPLVHEVVVDEGKAELGKKLWFDPRLSKSGFISCNSCHNLSMGGSDNLPTSIGHKWQEGPINSPTVLNSSLNFVQFWDGRAADLKEQAAGPIENPKEMASTHDLVVDVIASIPGYVDEFTEVYGDGDINIDRITDAIAVFEETLITPNSRFDQWLRGDDDAITAEELAGYELFRNSGCVACHYGEGIGGASFQKMGLLEEYKTDNLAKGLADYTGKKSDEMFFKVPTLRNVVLTYPYFHDGQVNTLEEATQIMGRLQLGRNFSDDDVKKIVAFYGTLTGEQPQIVLPILPPSNNDTPLPRPFDDEEEIVVEES